jgi:exopolyphosphatase/guanosine-5'-triphosphate,3'-diphosphate pyrophosphatase
MKNLSPEAIERGLSALQRMRKLADRHGAEITAVATSAVREAENAVEFLHRARDEAGIDVEVISGVEEARLIHLGVLQALPIFDQRALLVDVGGGSTEVLVGQHGQELAVRSFKLGAVRLTDRFFPGRSLHPASVQACRTYIRSALTVFRREVAEHGFELAVASSGTAEAVGRMVHAASGAAPLRTFNSFQWTATAHREVVERLVRARTVADRQKLPGLDPARADIILAGALILEGVIDVFGVRGYTYSDYALREGALLDAIQRRAELDGTGRAAMHHLRDVARRSVRQLADRCDDDPHHSAHVARLAAELFDQTQTLHRLGTEHRDYLEASALLANVGLVISHSKHHLHSYYVIRNSELVGFTDREIELIALIARYHRKSEPKPSHAEYAGLAAADQRVVRLLAGLLRVAIGLDRSHDARVQHVDVSITDRRVRITMQGHSDLDLSLERYAATERSGLLAAELGREITITD